MTAVLKYPAPLIEGRLEISMPHGAEILTVVLQRGSPVIYARAWSTARPESRVFQWRGTGHDCRGLAKYIGTVLIEDDTLVFHLFEEPRA